MKTQETQELWFCSFPTPAQKRVPSHLFSHSRHTSPKGKVIFRNKHDLAFHPRCVYVKSDSRPSSWWSLSVLIKYILVFSERALPHEAHEFKMALWIVEESWVMTMDCAGSWIPWFVNCLDGSQNHCVFPSGQLITLSPGASTSMDICVHSMVNFCLYW